MKMIFAKFVGGTEEIVIRKTRVIGYTLTSSETIDEYIIKYPYCHDGKKQKLKCKKIKGKY